MLRCDLHADEESGPGLDVIDAYARSHPDEAWIRGGGWFMAAFEGGTPRREDLDRIIPDRPAFLTNRDGHGAWVNSRALELAGITAATARPRGRPDRARPGRQRHRARSTKGRWTSSSG